MSFNTATSLYTLFFSFFSLFTDCAILDSIYEFLWILFFLLLFSLFMKHSVNRPPTPEEVDAEENELTLREIINIKLIESGEKERLMELVRERLVECGWNDEMKALCREFIKKKGRNDITVDELIHIITPKGRASVPDNVKAELLQRIRSFITSASL